MSQRETAVSREVEYETAKCVHCDDDIFIDDEKENFENMPEGINVIIAGGENITADKSNNPRANYKIPSIITKLFTSDDEKISFERQYMCPYCAKSLYGFGRD